jgi:hypothetical protein
MRRAEAADVGPSGREGRKSMKFHQSSRMTGNVLNAEWFVVTQLHQLLGVAGRPFV